MKLPKRSEVKTESPIEQMLYEELQRLGYYPVPQYKVGRYRIDLAFPEKMIAIECDGKQWHSSDDQKQNDERREEYIKSCGWKVIRVTGSDIYEYATAIADAVSCGKKPILPKKRAWDPINYEDDSLDIIQSREEERRISIFEQETDEGNFKGIKKIMEKRLNSFHENKN